jgi:TBC1 domain family protein 5
MELRNQQLSQMLNDVLSDLRSLSTADTDASSESTDAIDLAIAKLQFVQVYLEDSSMVLPTEASQKTAPPRSSRNSTISSKTPEASMEPLVEPGNKDSLAQSPSTMKDSSHAESFQTPETPNLSISTPLSTTQSRSSAGGLATTARPRAPIPTRSTLAQSSFAFMLEPDDSSATTSKSSSPKTSSPFLASGKRPLSGGSKGKAFLFGGESEDGEQSRWNPSSPNSANQEYNLGTIKGSKGR